MNGDNGGTGMYRDQPRTRAEEEAFVVAATGACDRKDWAACTTLANVLLRPQHVTANPARARELYSRACDHGVMTACGNLGVVLLADEKEDRARGLSLLRKACDAGDLGSCVNLGAELTAKRETPAHIEEGERLLKSTCDRFAPACHQLGAFYILGAAGRPDVSAGIAMYERACAMGLAMSCGVLGDIYGNGRFVPRDSSKAFGYLKQACEKGAQPACAMMAAAQAARRK